MYKCPKCGNTDRFEAYIELTSICYANLDGNKKITEIDDDIIHSITDFDVVGTMQCLKCGYDDNEEYFDEEFEE